MSNVGVKNFDGEEATFDGVALHPSTPLLEYAPSLS
jgi:hypothetical protein